LRRRLRPVGLGRIRRFRVARVPLYTASASSGTYRGGSDIPSGFLVGVQTPTCNTVQNRIRPTSILLTSVVVCGAHSDFLEALQPSDHPRVSVDRMCSAGL